MIKKESLMIGNLVSTYHNATFVIDQIKNTFVVHKSGIALTYEHLEGIPITDKIMQDYGFRLSCEGQYYKKGIHIERGIDLGYYLAYRYRENVSRKLNYVHELQNLWFALTGEQLKKEHLEIIKEFKQTPNGFTAVAIGTGVSLISVGMIVKTFSYSAPIKENFIVANTHIIKEGCLSIVYINYNPSLEGKEFFIEFYNGKVLTSIFENNSASQL